MKARIFTVIGGVFYSLGKACYDLGSWFYNRTEPGVPHSDVSDVQGGPEKSGLPRV